MSQDDESPARKRITLFFEQQTGEEEGVGTGFPSPQMRHLNWLLDDFASAIRRKDRGRAEGYSLTEGE